MESEQPALHSAVLIEADKTVNTVSSIQLWDINQGIEVTTIDIQTSGLALSSIAPLISPNGSTFLNLRSTNPLNC